MSQVIVPPVRVQFTPLPAYNRYRRRTFIASLFVCARPARRGTRVRIKTLNGRPHGRTGRNWTVIHCMETPKVIYALVREALEKERRGC